jgi:hypothetical protein
VDANHRETCALSAEGNCNASSSCNTFPPGTRLDGRPCYSFAQCASLWCAGIVVVDQAGERNPRALQCGTCRTQLPEGAACNVVTEFCQAGTPGLSCFRGVCRLRGLPGTACDSWNDCAAPSICNSAGFCGAANQAGETCVSGTDCAGELSCDPATKTCAFGEHGQPGDACDGEFHWCWLGRCNIAEGASTGVCPLVIPDGAACDPDDPARTCDSFAFCMNGVCQIPDANTCG